MGVSPRIKTILNYFSYPTRSEADVGSQDNMHLVSISFGDR